MYHFLYKNLIFKIVRFWEHGHLPVNLGVKYCFNGKVNFDLIIFFLFIYFV
jgi:hypothetical protein